MSLGSPSRKRFLLGALSGESAFGSESRATLLVGKLGWPGMFRIYRDRICRDITSSNLLFNRSMQPIYSTDAMMESP
jgi:hypothetical protein